MCTITFAPVRLYQACKIAFDLLSIEFIFYSFTPRARAHTHIYHDRPNRMNQNQRAPWFCPRQKHKNFMVSLEIRGALMKYRINCQFAWIFDFREKKCVSACKRSSHLSQWQIALRHTCACITNRYRTRTHFSVWYSRILFLRTVLLVKELLIIIFFTTTAHCNNKKSHSTRTVTCTQLKPL